MRRITSAVAAITVTLLGAALAVGPPSAYAVSPGYNVFVGYADNARPSPTAFPTPFDTGPGITNLGDSSSASLDSGAVRLVNTTAVTETVNSVLVQVGATTFSPPWALPTQLGPFGQLVFDQTVPYDFDTSDVQGGICTPTSPAVIPTVTVTVNGTPTSYSDTGQVLNTGGIDPASCGLKNESEQWVSIGAPPCPSGAVLTLTPPSQTEPVGTTASVVANFSSCGTPLQGATVTFGVLAGPNQGTTESTAVDMNGYATFTYSSIRTGTDTVQAFVQNAAGTIGSNGVGVIWTPAQPSLTTTPPPSIPVGGTMGSDVATLSGGVNPTGVIGFALFAPGDTTCQTPIFLRFDPVSGNGNYSSGAVGRVTTPGTYRWLVVYNGDASNASVTSPCGAEQTVVTAQVLTGRAYGLSLGGLVHVKPTPDTGFVTTSASRTVAPPCVVRLSVTHVIANALCASVVTSAPFPSSSTARTSIASATVSGISGIPAIVIGAVQSSSTSSCAGSTGATTIASLKIGSTVILPAPSPVRPNMTINLGILKIVLNQQIPITGADMGLTVNAIHITALNGTINLVVASSESDIANCP